MYTVWTPTIWKLLKSLTNPLVPYTLLLAKAYSIFTTCVVENLHGLESTPTVQATATQMKILVIPALI